MVSADPTLMALAQMGASIEALRSARASGVRPGFARLMAVADGRTDYIRFLYERVGPLRARRFAQMLERAAAEGRLPKGIATLTERGVHLREAALTPQGTPQGVFEIDFVQMPRLAALLDFLHNALGFTVVADLMAPLLPKSGAPQASADDVARALQAALNAWLSQRLESTNHILQAQHIRGFVASRGHLAPETIDDETILLFWIKAAEANDQDRIEGFRLYRTVAMSMLRYRRALRDAMSERHLEYALGRGLEAANDSVPSDQAELRTMSWHSPLRGLAVPPASRVKWLTAKELDALRNFMGGQRDDDAPIEDASPDRAEGDESGEWSGGLGGDERFDLAHWLTLLRADVYGAVQASIVGRLRKRAEAQTAIAQALEALDPAAYDAAVKTYAEVRSQLHVESLATLALLMEAGAPEAVILLRWLGGDAAIRAVLGPATERRTSDDDDDDDDREERDDAGDFAAKIASRLIAAATDVTILSPGAARTLVSEALAARRKVSRAGFRREDRADPGMAEALRSGAAVLFEVIRELDRLGDVLAAKTPGADLAGDRVRFTAAFQRIYLNR